MYCTFVNKEINNYQGTNVLNVTKVYRCIQYMNDCKIHTMYKNCNYYYATKYKFYKFFLYKYEYFSYRKYMYLV